MKKMKKISQKIKLQFSTALLTAFLLFKFNANAQTPTGSYIVPPCVTSIVVEVVGAKGGTGKQANGPLALGGNGGRVQATIIVIPGEVLNLYNGDQGQMSYQPVPTNWAGGGGGGLNMQYQDGNIFAGTGGGCSQIRRSPYSTNDILVVAGGGGGASPYNNGGHGGGLIAQAGWSGFPSQASQPGTQSSGGAPTQFCGDGIPTAGGAFYGGNGSSSTQFANHGGGGGGGYYGGGGGTCGDGGSGGSSYTIPGSINVVHTNGYNNLGNGYINITPNTTLAAPSLITGITSMCANSSANNYSVALVNGATSYSWTVPAGANITSGQGTNSITVAFGSSGSQISVIASNSCTSSSATIKTITVNPTPTIAVNSGTICSGQSFTIIPSGANTYTIQGGNAVVSPVSLTTYTVKGSSAAGCVSTNTATSTVTVNTTPNVSVNSGAICSGQSFTMVPSGASTYTIQGGSNTVSPLSNTSYTVVGTSTAGCVSANTATSNVTVNTTPTIVVNSGVICSGNSFTIAPSGANAYTFQGGSAIVSPTTNASYTVVGTSAAGCVSASSATSNITVNTLPTIVVNSGAICSGRSFTMVPSGASTYTFSSGSAVVSPTSNTSYNVTGTSAQGCISANTATSNVTVNATPTVTINSGAICSGQSFTLIPSGAFTYTISGGSAVVSPTANTLYFVTGTSAQNCVSSNTAISTITVNALPNVSAASNTSLICVGQSASLTASGATSYTWNTTATTTIIAISPTVTTSYTVNGTAANGCSNVATVIQSVSACTGIQQIVNSSNELIVFPNPFNSKITIVSNLPAGGLSQAGGVKQSVQVYNALGSIVYDAIIENENLPTGALAKTGIEIDLTQQANGIYFVRIGSITKKIIKE